MIESYSEKLERAKDAAQKVMLKDDVQKFIDYEQKHGKDTKRKNWYVGFTKRDPNVRKEEHEKDPEKTIVCEYFKALIDDYPDEKTARALEAALKEKGFPIEWDDVEVITESKPTKSSSVTNAKKSDDRYKVYIYLAVKKK